MLCCINAKLKLKLNFQNITFTACLKETGGRELTNLSS